MIDEDNAPTRTERGREHANRTRTLLKLVILCMDVQETG
jgi:hypothetical protein